MWVRTQGGSASPERNDFSEHRGAVSVPNETFPRRVQHVGPAPKVMPCLINTHHPHTEFGGELDRLLHRRISDGRSKLTIGVPDSAGGEMRRNLFHRGPWDTPTHTRPELVIQMQRLDGVVRPDPMLRRFPAEPPHCGNFFRVLSSVAEGRSDEVVMGSLRNDKNGSMHALPHLDGMAAPI